MASSWKQSPTSVSRGPKKVAFTDACKFFAVDASGSTAGHVIQVEGRFVENWHSNQRDAFCKWGSSCSEPKIVSSIADSGDKSTKRPLWNADQGGTSPSQILRCKSARDSIRQSDAWFLMTDGEVYEGDVQALANLASQECITNVPVCLVIFGVRQITPKQVNISVGIPLFAASSEALLLFKDTTSKKIYVVAAKGVFSPLAKIPSHIDLTSWADLASFDDDRALINECHEKNIELICSFDRHDTSAVSLGPVWDSSTTGSLVDIDILLRQASIEPEDLDNLLQDEAFTQLALVCKTRRKLTELRSLLVRHKQTEMIVRLQDTNGAAQILQRLRAPNISQLEREELATKLRDAHTANRQAYLTEKDAPNEEVQAVRKLNRAIDRALATLAEMDVAGYTADILDRKSNRARRADAVSAADAKVHLSGLDLSDNANAYRGTCSICCGEQEIMSIVLKKLESVEENTSDFFLNFPLVAAQAQQNADMISSQCICFQCATLISNQSIFKEDLSAILPVVEYVDENKRYINHQLAMAITAGLATGAAGIVQMFMSILDHTLENKKWCSLQPDVQASDPEVSHRRQTLEWMLKMLLRTCITRERFSDETSLWVPYPSALSWAVSDWENNKLDSWMIQYPLKGFNQLMRWYTISEPCICVKGETLEQIKTTKTLNVVISAFLTRLLQTRHDRTWVHDFMRLIYRGFNATNVPRDMGDQSIVAVSHFWPKLENVLGTREDGKQFLASVAPSARAEICRRVQLVVFWATFNQKEHVTAKGFFHKTLLREPLAAAILDPMTILPDENTLQSTLRSIFLVVGDSTDAAHEGVPPFVTPFGPSIISCGKEKCKKLFYDSGKLRSFHPDLVRERRAEHMNSVFQRGSDNPTGLPEPTHAPERPKSLHYTLHMSIVKVWSTLPRSGHEARSDGPIQAGHAINFSKEDVINGKEQAVEHFVTQAREHICAESHRGNIYCNKLEEEIRELLPSFFAALRVASEKDGLDDKSGLSYVHDWTKNKLADKILFELSLTEMTPDARLEVSKIVAHPLGGKAAREARAAGIVLTTTR